MVMDCTLQQPDIDRWRGQPPKISIEYSSTDVPQKAPTFFKLKLARYCSSLKLIIVLNDECVKNTVLYTCMDDEEKLLII